MDHKELAAEIVKNVGGEENIKSVSHCMTRLRFILQDVQKADKDALENLKGVLGVIYAGGQYMVILGQILLPVYEHVLKDFHIADGGSIDENLDEIKEKEPLSVKTVFNEMIGYVSRRHDEGRSAFDCYIYQSGFRCNFVIFTSCCDRRCTVLLYADYCGLWCGG